MKNSPPQQKPPEEPATTRTPRSPTAQREKPATLAGPSSAPIEVPIMTTLATEHCVPSQNGDSPMTAEEIELLLPQLPGWSFVADEHGGRLERNYRFGNFMEALAFTKR